jgi:group I intron endonuclease
VPVLKEPKMNYKGPVLPVKVYEDVGIYKLQVIKENKIKAGVYRFINKTNGKSYIGSSSNLGRRFTEYYSILYLQKQIEKGKSLICNSLLKYGYHSFSLEILEYCEVNKATTREQYFLDLLFPEYNILSKAGSSLGHIHSDETKAKLSLA